MEALRVWRASFNLLGFAASRAAAASAGRAHRFHIRCCSPAAAATTKPPQDRRRRSASSSSTSDRDSIRAIRLKKVSSSSAATCYAPAWTLLGAPLYSPQSVADTAVNLLEISSLFGLLGRGAKREGLRTVRVQVGQDSHDQGASGEVHPSREWWSLHRGVGFHCW